MSISTYEWAVLDVGPIVQYDRGGALTGASATFDLELQATGKPTNVKNQQPGVGATRSAPADIAGTVTVTGLPTAWHDGWGGSITFEADEDTAAWLGWMAVKF
jgi:hypothetical protein